MAKTHAARSMTPTTTVVNGLTCSASPLPICMTKAPRNGSVYTVAVEAFAGAANKCSRCAHILTTST